MAIVQNPLTGRTRKSFGTAVFSKQFGKNTMRTKPVQVKNPKTPKQLRQRKKFSEMTTLIRPLIPLINSVYAGSIKDMSPYNKICSLNLKNAFVGEPPVVDHTKVVLCTFDGSTVAHVTITALANHVMQIDWQHNTTNADELASRISLIMFNCTSNESVIFSEVAVRSAGTVNVTVPDTWVGALTTVHVLTTDYSMELAGAPQKILKFKAGADLANVVK